MDVERLRKKFEALYNNVRINDEDYKIEKLSNSKTIRPDFPNNHDFSAHTIDFAEENNRPNANSDDKRIWDGSYHDNSPNNIRVLGYLNDSHCDANDTAEHIRLLEYRSRSKLIRK